MTHNPLTIRDKVCHSTWTHISLHCCAALLSLSWLRQKGVWLLIRSTISRVRTCDYLWRLYTVVSRMSLRSSVLEVLLILSLPTQVKWMFHIVLGSLSTSGNTWTTTSKAVWENRIFCGTSSASVCSHMQKTAGECWRWSRWFEREAEAWVGIPDWMPHRSLNQMNYFGIGHHCSFSLHPLHSFVYLPDINRSTDCCHTWG